MTIKRRIFIFNTLMVSVSLLMLLLIGGGLISIFKEKYLDGESLNSRLNKNVYEVQTELKTLLNTSPDWNAVSDKLISLDYVLYVYSKQDKIYSNIDEHARKSIKSLEKNGIEKNKISLYFIDDKTIVATSYEINEKDYNVIAINNVGRREFHELNREKFEIFLIIFIMIGIFSIFVLLLVSQLFTKELVKCIMNPVNKLIDGAKRIEEGNLEVAVDYKGEEEFEKVCLTFNKMQIHLKNEREKNASYEKARTDMISGISHDLRTPLTSVKGYIKGLKDGVANTPEKQEKYLNIAYNKACDMDVLLQRLFYFSKLETGNMPFFFIETDLSEIIENFTTYVRENSAKNNIKINFDKSNEMHSALIDTEQFKRVLTNIVENSIKYAKSDFLELTFSLSKIDNAEILIISDNGIGVPPEKLSRLFEQFYRGDESRSSKNTDGNGLGLYISKYIIEAHGGNIFAENSNGFKITITLPQRKE